MENQAKNDETEAINRVLLKRLGVTDSEIETIVKSSDATIQVKNRILKTLGLTLEDIKKIEEDMSGTEIDKVLKACQKAGNKIHVGQGHYSFLGILTKPFERNLEVRGVGNKLYSLGDGAKTNFGRLMSKFVQQAYRGLTFNAGKLGLLIFITPGLVRAMENTKKADKDKKVGTAAWGILDTLTWVITFPLSINLLYGLGGMRYAGMTKDKVEACRKIKAEFNEKVCNGSLKEKSAYDRALKEAKGKVKELEKVKAADETILATIVDMVKGGVLVDVSGVKGFVPTSHLRCKESDLKIGEKIELKILTLDTQQSNFILSNKKAKLFLNKNSKFVSKNI